MTPHVSTTLLRTQTDQRLVELIAAGHDRAFDAIVDRYRRPLLRYARRFLHEDARAEDVVQSAFVSAWTALNEGATVRDLRPWLYRIVHNGALNVMKKPGRDDAILIEASDLRPGPAAEVEQRDDVRRALDTISRLPERQRTALLAVAFDGRSHADVGAELGLKEPAVRQLVSRARTSLRVAATAVTPWPVAAWLAGIGGTQAGDTAARVGEIAGGVGAGTVFGGGALKAGALVAAAGAVAVSAPKMAEVAHHNTHRPVATASASTASASQQRTTGAPAAAGRPASGAPGLRVVSSAAGGLTAGVRAHRRSSGGETSGGWNHSTRGATTPTSWTPGRAGGSSDQAGESAPAPVVTETQRSGRHGESEDHVQHSSPSAQSRHQGSSGARRERHGTRTSQGGDATTTTGSTHDRSGGDDSTSRGGTRDAWRDRADSGDSEPTSSSGSSSSGSSSSGSDSGSQSGSSRPSQEQDAPDSGDSGDKPASGTAPAPTP